MDEVARLLDEIENEEPGASDKLLLLVYDELRRLAAARLAKERPGQTIEPTALVHEAYLRLLGPGRREPWDGKGHFFAAAASAMMRILVENARRKKRIKHGGGMDRVEFGDGPAGVAAPDGLASVAASDDEVIALGEALEALTLAHPEAASVVKLHFLAGLTHEQAGAALGFSRRESERKWGFARAWLRRRMEGEPAPGRG